MFCPKAGPSLQAKKPRLQSCRRQVFHCKLRNHGCSFTRDLIGEVVSSCFPHPTLSFSIWTNRKRSQGTTEEVRKVDLANWALRTSRKFATGVKHQFHQGFWPEPHSVFSIWTDLKRSEKIPGAPTRRWGEWIWLTGPCRLHRSSPQGLNFSSIRVSDQNPTLSLASELTLKDLKTSQGHQHGGEEWGFGKLGPPGLTEIHHRS